MKQFRKIDQCRILSGRWSFVLIPLVSDCAFTLHHKRKSGEVLTVTLLDEILRRSMEPTYLNVFMKSIGWVFDYR